MSEQKSGRKTFNKIKIHEHVSLLIENEIYGNQIVPHKSDHVTPDEVRNVLKVIISVNQHGNRRPCYTRITIQEQLCCIIITHVKLLSILQN